MTNEEEVLPNTARIVEGFRDTGYSFEAAIADLIDNSIEAGATGIGVQVHRLANKELVVSVADNGSGMDIAELRNAMRYGADERSDPHRLGRFGLGLKTASTSFCRRLTVISRKDSTPAGDLVAATWDLDVVVERNAWVLEIGAASQEQEEQFLEALEAGGHDGSHGTVVVWDKVDRLLRKKHGGEYQDIEAAITRRLKSLNVHIRMVFQRFLDASDARVRNVQISVKGEALEAWDPFCEKFPEVSPVKEKDYSLSHAATSIEGVVSIRAFILPKPNETSDPAAFRVAAGTKGSGLQGFFVYREGRMIDEPGWLHLQQPETHLRSLRIEMNFPATLDTFFGVGLRKTGLKLDPGFAEVLVELIRPLVREANRQDRKGKSKSAVEKTTGQRPSDRSIGEQRPGLTMATVTESSDGSITLTNNQTEEGEVYVLRSGDSSVAPDFRIEIVEGPDEIYVAPVETLEDGVLWEPAYRQGPKGDTQVRVNAGHDWYQRSYLPQKDNSVFCQSIDFLLFALAQAELNNTNLELDEDFRQFRVEVSRNLRKLVADLPEYDGED